MARPGRNQPSEIPRPPTVDPERGVRLIEEQITKGRELSMSPVKENDNDSWNLLTENYLQMAFGSDSDNVSRVMELGRLRMIPLDADESWWENSRAERLQAMVSALESLVVLLNTKFEPVRLLAVQPVLSVPS